jgi:putative transposase
VPRANRYFLPGKLYRLTHRCHNRQFLFKFAKDRNRSRQMMWGSLDHAAVEVFSYCLTSTHTHFLVRSEEPGLIS